MSEQQVQLQGEQQVQQSQSEESSNNQETSAAVQVHDSVPGSADGDDPKVMITSPLLATNLYPLGATIFYALLNEFKADIHNLKVYEFGYCAFLRKHPEFNEEYKETLLAQDTERGSRLVLHIAKIISDHIGTKIIKVVQDIETVKNKLLEITARPDFQQRSVTVQQIKDAFLCNEDDLKAFSDYIEQLDVYSGSMLGVGSTPDNETALIIYVFSV